MKKAISLLSGGLDSSVATLLAREKFEITLALTFNYGQRAAIREIEAAKTFCSRYKITHEIIELPWLAKISKSALIKKSMKLPTYTDRDLDNNYEAEKTSAEAVWVPNRNAIFVNVAAAYAEAKKIHSIVAGFNVEEAKTFPDNSKKFIESANKLFSSSTLSHPKLLCPVQKMTKAEVVTEALRLKLDPHFFWSCYSDGANMCGQCESCARMIRAFKTIGAFDMIKPKIKYQKSKTHIKNEKI